MQAHWWYIPTVTCMCSSFLFISCVGRSVPSVVPCTKRTKRDSLSLLSRYRAYMYYIVSSSHSPHFSLSPFPSLTTQEIHLTIKGKGEGRGEMGLVPRLVMLAGLTWNGPFSLIYICRQVCRCTYIYTYMLCSSVSLTDRSCWACVSRREVKTTRPSSPPTSCTLLGSILASSGQCNKLITEFQWYAVDSMCRLLFSAFASP